MPWLLMPEKKTPIFIIGNKGDAYDFMLFSDPYIEIFLQEIKTVREKHKIIDVPYIPSGLRIST